MTVRLSAAAILADAAVQPRAPIKYSGIYRRVKDVPVPICVVPLLDSADIHVELPRVDYGNVTADRLTIQAHFVAITGANFGAQAGPRPSSCTGDSRVGRRTRNTLFRGTGRCASHEVAGDLK